MRYPAKELKAEAYKAYSKDAFSDEERGVAYYLHNYRYKLTAGEVDKFDDILSRNNTLCHFTASAWTVNKNKTNIIF